ncbi:MAG TPA: hypothetical protein VL866_19530 [Pyrinomonadaceae bacterium]|nr:hypothetical protein [Pyrinomonadaceae bacterium]
MSTPKYPCRSGRALKCLLGTTFLLMPLIYLPDKREVQSASKLLKDGSRYQAADDTSDRAADLYRELLRKYPKSVEAESAQFFLGSYYQVKFFILEQRSKVQDWNSFNLAEDELYRYIGKYPKGAYLADAYNRLAIVALRRGYASNARSLWSKMKAAGVTDRKVYVAKVTWSPTTDDQIKGYCDTKLLADASLEAMDKNNNFNGVVYALTNWAKSRCR